MVDQKQKTLGVYSHRWRSEKKKGECSSSFVTGWRNWTPLECAATRKWPDGKIFELWTWKSVVPYIGSLRTFLMYITFASDAVIPRPAESFEKISEIFCCSLWMRASQSKSCCAVTSGVGISCSPSRSSRTEQGRSFHARTARATRPRSRRAWTASGAVARCSRSPPAGEEEAVQRAGRRGRGVWGGVGRGRRRA